VHDVGTQSRESLMQKIDFFAVTKRPIPSRLHGSESSCTIRQLFPKERLGIEDQFFKKGIRLTLEPNTTAIVISQRFNDQDNLEECATLIEFAIAIITISGFQPVDIAASFTNGNCINAESRYSSVLSLTTPIFAKSLEGIAVTKWITRFLNAHSKTPDRMHITANRFVRYSRDPNPNDALMDLCICLESLLDSQTEVSFRYGVCLTKVTESKGREAEDTAKTLSGLYELRSKLAHGDPSSSKLFNNIQPSLSELRKTARTILTNYVLFLSEHSRSEWKRHLHTLLFA
jgi:hypothetical protein